MRADPPPENPPSQSKAKAPHRCGACFASDLLPRPTRVATRSRLPGRPVLLHLERFHHNTAGAAASGEHAEEGVQEPQTGAIMTYFGEKGFGFLRPDSGGKDIFFHVSRLQDGDATELVPGKRIAYELGMDRNGKIAASSLRFLQEEAPPAAPEA